MNKKTLKQWKEYCNWVEESGHEKGMKEYKKAMREYKLKHKIWEQTKPKEGKMLFFKTPVSPLSMANWHMFKPLLPRLETYLNITKPTQEGFMTWLADKELNPNSR